MIQEDEMTDAPFQQPDYAAQDPYGVGEQPYTEPVAIKQPNGQAPTLPIPAAASARTKKGDITLVRTYNIWCKTHNSYVGSFLDREEALTARTTHFDEHHAKEIANS